MTAGIKKLTGKKCTCPCHKPGSNMKHIKPCCKNGIAEDPIPIKDKPDMKLFTFIISCTENAKEIKKQIELSQFNAAHFKSVQFLFLVDDSTRGGKECVNIVHHLYTKLPQPDLFKLEHPTVRITSKKNKNPMKIAESAIGLINGKLIHFITDLHVFDKKDWEHSFDVDDAIQVDINTPLKTVEQLSKRLTKLKTELQLQ